MPSSLAIMPLLVTPGVLPQVGSDGLLLGAYAVRIFGSLSGAEGGDLRFHLEDQLLQLLLTLLLRVSVDVSGVLFAVRPDGRVSPPPRGFL